MTESGATRGTSELEREIAEAEAARVEAEAAIQRAEAARAEADAVRRRMEEEHERNRLDWARGVVDAYDADLAAAEAAIRAASDRFTAAAVENLQGAVAAYLAWAEASLRHYTLQVRAATVAPLLDMEASPSERLSVPPFSQALDTALEHHVSELSSRIRNETAAEIADHLDAAVTVPEASR